MSFDAAEIAAIIDANTVMKQFGLLTRTPNLTGERMDHSRSIKYRDLPKGVELRW